MKNRKIVNIFEPKQDGAHKKKSKWLYFANLFQSISSISVKLVLHWIFIGREMGWGGGGGAGTEEREPFLMT